MKSLILPCDASQVSDGFHTFGELYDHRCVLFLALMKCEEVPTAWISRLHDDETHFDGYFVAGMTLPTGDVTYHLPDHMWTMATLTGAKILDKAPKFDGHNSFDVLERITDYVGK